MNNEYDVLTDDDGMIRYYKKDTDILHRLDGPAVIWPSGTMIYYVNGRTHRVDGPAMVWGNGDLEYYVNGLLHRIDGPAVIYKDEKEEYWLYGQEATLEEISLIKMIYEQ